MGLVLALLLAAGMLHSATDSCCPARFQENTVDPYLELALDFTGAVYVKDWDGAPDRFHYTPRASDGSYRLMRLNWHSSLAFNQLARNFRWQLYFNNVMFDGKRLQDAQILTGSARRPDGLPVFVIAFRGSDKIEDYLYTNCNTEPVPTTWATFIEESSHPADGNNLMTKLNNYVVNFVVDLLPAGMLELFNNALLTCLSDQSFNAAVLIHRGYLEQARSALGSRLVDPADGSVTTVLDALVKYPQADFLITGHSSGGGAAQGLVILIREMGLDNANRIHARTFATTGAFNRAGSIKYADQDIINYFIPGDFIIFVNGLTGYMTAGTDVMLPPLYKYPYYSNGLHEMTSYDEHIKNTLLLKPPASL